jgi:riboflavin transporter FmnP
MTVLDSDDYSESDLHIAPVIVATCIKSQVIVTLNFVLKAPLYYCEELS